MTDRDNKWTDYDDCRCDSDDSRLDSDDGRPDTDDKPQFITSLQIKVNKKKYQQRFYSVYCK